MIRRLPAAGSYAPVTILIQELPGDETQVAHDTVASATVPNGDAAASQVARRLDIEVLGLLHHATGRAPNCCTSVFDRRLRLVLATCPEADTALAVRAETFALTIPRDHQDNDHGNRNHRRYQDHHKNVLEDPVLAHLPLLFLQRHSGRRRMIARGRIVQVKSSAAPAQAVSRVPSRATNPNHHASRRPTARITLSTTRARLAL